MNSVKTIRVPCETRITTLATNTTLGTATRHDFAAVTVNMPETTRTIRSVIVEVSARDVFATAIDFDGWRIGTKINAVAFGDTDYTITQGNSGDHSTIILRHDATSYFVTNDPATATFTAQIGVAYATGSASNVTGICAVLIITYEYDPAASTHVKTVAIPLQCHHTSVSTSYVEVGTVSGTANAPANQIPQLTGAGSPFLPETSVSIKDYWLDISGVDAAGTNHTLTVRVDGSTDIPRFLCDQTLSTLVNYYDRISLTTTTTAAHAFEAKCDATTFVGIGAVLWVTYTFDPTSTTQLVSIQQPLEAVDAVATDSTSTDAERYLVTVDVQEPATITMKQTGVVIQESLNNTNRLVLASGQTLRTYTEPSAAVRDGSFPVIHRCDHSGSTWYLERGRNRLTVDVYAAAESTNPLYGGVAYINYHCGLSPQGCQAHARTTAWLIVGQVEIAVLVRTNRSPTAPNIPETNWALSGAFVETVDYSPGTTSKWVAAKRSSGEGVSSGWQTGQTTTGVASDTGSKRNIIPTTSWFRRSSLSNDADRMALETTRDWVISGNQNIEVSAIHYVTHHSNLFAVAGTVTINGVVAAADGKLVKIYADDAMHSTPKWRATGALATGTGAITVVPPDTAANCIEILFVESAGLDPVPTLSTPAGFAQIATYVDTNVSSGSRLTSFWRRSTSAVMTSPVVADTGDHTSGVIMSFDDCVETGNPYDAETGDSDGSFTTAITIPGATTTVDHCLAVLAVTSGGQTTVGTWSNANLVPIVPDERADLNTASGDDGGIAVAVGIKLTAGAIGNTTAVLSSANGQARQCISLIGRPIGTAVEYITTATVAGGAGAFTVNVNGNVRNFWASYDDSAASKYGRSLGGTPGSSTFNIAVGGPSISRGRLANA